MNTTSSSFPLRLPSELRNLLKIKAKNNSRSLNAEIVNLLTSSIGPAEKIRDLTIEDLQLILKTQIPQQQENIGTSNAAFSQKELSLIGQIETKTLQSIRSELSAFKDALPKLISSLVVSELIEKLGEPMEESDSIDSDLEDQKTGS